MRPASARQAQPFSPLLGPRRRTNHSAPAPMPRCVSLAAFMSQEMIQAVILRKGRQIAGFGERLAESRRRLYDAAWVFCRSSSQWRIGGDRHHLSAPR